MDALRKQTGLFQGNAGPEFNLKSTSQTEVPGSTWQNLVFSAKSYESFSQDDAYSE